MILLAWKGNTMQNPDFLQESALPGQELTDSYQLSFCMSLAIG
jgi:hypothetical protein